MGGVTLRSDAEPQVRVWEDGVSAMSLHCCRGRKAAPSVHFRISGAERCDLSER